MIKVEVVIDNNKWKKKIKRANFFFNKILRFFPKKYKFEKKKILFSLSLSDNYKIRKLNKKFRNVVYICMTPRKWCSAKDIKKRIKAFF